MEPQPPAAPVRHLGKYRLDHLLGRGGMGEVYQAWDTTLERVVAVKTIRAESDDAQHAERFRREGKAAARLRHPLIVTVYELGEADGRLYMAMEYLEGESLAAAVRTGRLTLEQRLDALALILDGLHHAHQHGVVHRDVKPSNVQLLPDGGLKILDFGIARLTMADSLSHTGMVLGTVPYMSPEQLRGERVDFRTDVYAAGVLGYELLTGRRPFDGDTLTEIVLKVINDPLPPMAGPVAERFPQVEGVLARALEKQADLRFASAAEMAAALRAAAHPAPAEPRASTTYRVPIVPQSPSPAPSIPPAACEAGESCAGPSHMPEGAAVGRRRLRVTAVTVLGLAVLSSAALMGRGKGAPDLPAPLVATPPSARPPGVVPVPPDPPPAFVPPPAPTNPVRGSGTVALGGDARLARALAARLREHGLRLGGGDRVEARITITLRPSPFAAASARTADFSAGAVVHRAGRRAVRCDADGHALDFGEGPARTSAVERAAEQLAACLARGAR